jgi:hypothetical protein
MMKRETKLLASGLILAFALATQGGCAGSAKVTQPTAQTAPTRNQPVLAGRVMETMNAGGYTYINLQKDGEIVWVALPTMEVKVGDEVELIPGAQMYSFASKSLNRTFDKIIFSAGPVAKPASQSAPMPAGHPTLPAAADQKKPAPLPAVKETLAEKPFYAGKVVETMSSGGYTYICLENDGKKSWVAVPPTEVKLGDDIVVQPGMEMGKFTSKTLNRTFDNIIFSPGIVPKK